MRSGTPRPMERKISSAPEATPTPRKRRRWSSSWSSLSAEVAATVRVREMSRLRVPSSGGPLRIPSCRRRSSRNPSRRRLPESSPEPTCIMPMGPERTISDSLSRARLLRRRRRSSGGQYSRAASPTLARNVPRASWSTSRNSPIRCSLRRAWNSRSASEAFWTSAWRRAQVQISAASGSAGALITRATESVTMRGGRRSVRYCSTSRRASFISGSVSGASEGATGRGLASACRRPAGGPASRGAPERASRASRRASRISAASW